MPNVNDQLQQDREFARSRGNRLNQDNEDRAGNHGRNAEYYRLYGDEINEALMSGGGGFLPDEIDAMNQEGELERGRTSDDEYASNYLTGEEQNQIRGNPWSRTAYFDPETMNNFNRASHGRMRESAAGIGRGMRDAITDDLNMSERYDQNSDAALSDMTSRVRGGLDPNRLRTSEAALNRIRMTPGEEQDIITAGGIAARTGYDAQMGRADRAGRAAGVDPLGMAALRGRNNRESAGAAADAETEARVRAGSERARREGVAEQMRQEGEYAYTDRNTGAETTIGGMRLNREGQRENTRLGAARDRSDRFSDAARVGGQAELAAETTANASERQQSQFNAGLGTDIATGIERDEAARAAAVAGNRQQTGRTNQTQRAGQSTAIAGHRADVARTAGQARREGAQEGRQGVRANLGVSAGREDANLNRQQQTFGQQGQQMQGNTGQAIQQSQAPTWWERGIGAAAGIAGAVAPILTGGIGGGGATSRIKR